MEKGEGKTTLVHCEELWRAIHSARGFHHGFAAWALANLRVFVPVALPPRCFVDVLYAEMTTVVRTVEQQMRLQECRALATAMRADCSKGGSRAYFTVRDLPTPPLTALAASFEVHVRRVRWPKTGLQVLACHDSVQQFVPGLPIQFQEQEAFVEAVRDNILVLDRPVRLRSSDMTVRQLATCPYADFCHSVWLEPVSSISAKSARGSCRFSAQDLSMIRGTLLDWLFAIFRAAESELGWPQRLLAAKVALLAKSELVPTDPLQTRPITIISRLYRAWSKYRSTQVLDYPRNIVPAAVRGPFWH